MAFVDEHRDEFGVEPICNELPMAPSTYYDYKRQPLSARAIRDAMMMTILMAIWVTNRKVYGAHKLWKAAKRAGHEIGRDQTARLMRTMGIRGVSRRRRVFTTRRDPDATRAEDLVDRDFTAEAPNQLWVTDLTYVPTRSGMAYVCFITDAFSRMIVGWRVATHMRTEMVIDALEMARRSRGSRRLGGRWRIPTPDPSSPACVTPNASTRSVPHRRSGLSPTRTTTRWPRRSTGSTRPNWSTVPTRDAGTTSTSSNSKPSPGSTGTTTTGFTATVETSHPSNTRRPTTLN
mgnify:CR=1 FL=1